MAHHPVAALFVCMHAGGDRRRTQGRGANMCCFKVSKRNSLCFRHGSASCRVATCNYLQGLYTAAARLCFRLALSLKSLLNVGYQHTAQSCLKKPYCRLSGRPLVGFGMLHCQTPDKNMVTNPHALTPHASEFQDSL